MCSEPQSGLSALFRRARNRAPPAQIADKNNKLNTKQIEKTTKIKKTLIALLALGSCAMGVTLEDADRLGYGGSTFTTTDGNFTVALTLDVTELRSILDNGQNAHWGTDIVSYDINGAKTGVTVNGSSANGKINNNSGLAARRRRK